MTRERAQYLLDNTRLQGDFKYAFARPYAAFETLYQDGITADEDREIKALWDTMPGNSRYYDVLRRIARGEQ